MAPRFLGKTILDGIEVIRGPSGLALENYARLRALLSERLGPSATELLAEPIVTWAANPSESSVSWYSEAPGEPHPLASLPAERQRVLEDRLRGLLARAMPLLADADIGPVLQRALCILSPRGLWAVGEQIVLTDWGLIAAGSGVSGDGMALLRRTPVGTYLPSSVASSAGQPTTIEPPASVSPPRAPQAASPLAPTADPPRTAIADASKVRRWWPVPAALAIAALFLAFGYWKGSQLAAARAAARSSTVTVADEAALKDATAKQIALNTALEKQIEERRRLLAGNVCQIDPATMPRIGPDRAAIPPPAVVPPPPGGQPFQGNLADLLKQALVMVVVPNAAGDDASIGSGFYVASDLIVTNRHVVEGIADGRVAITNEKLGHVVRGDVIAMSPTSDVGSLDVALIRVAANPSMQPLSFTTTAAELDPVIAAGYPALVIRGDAATRRLLVDGDMTAAPQLVLTDGRINAIQMSQGGIKIMPHSANISGGNSGGPLVDACGRVVGINTFITTDREQTAHVNYAQKADAVVVFLKDHGAAIAELSGPCAPTAPAPTPVATPAAPFTAPGAPSPLVPSPAAPPAPR